MLNEDSSRMDINAGFMGDPCRPAGSEGRHRRDRAAAFRRFRRLRWVGQAAQKEIGAKTWTGKKEEIEGTSEKFESTWRSKVINKSTKKEANTEEEKGGQR